MHSILHVIFIVFLFSLWLNMITFYPCLTLMTSINQWYSTYSCCICYMFWCFWCFWCVICVYFLNYYYFRNVNLLFLIKLLFNICWIFFIFIDCKLTPIFFMYKYSIFWCFITWKRCCWCTICYIWWIWININWINHKAFDHFQSTWVWINFLEISISLRIILKNDEYMMVSMDCGNVRVM